MLSKSPNPAHLAIAECAERLKGEGRRLRVITQNIDELHTTAGTKNLLELHGSLFRVRCIDCGEVTENKDSPICKALEGRGAPDPDAQAARIPEKVFQRKYSSRFWRSSNCTCQGSSKMSKANVWRPSQAACGLVW